MHAGMGLLKFAQARLHGVEHTHFAGVLGAADGEGDHWLAVEACDRCDFARGIGDGAEIAQAHALSVSACQAHLRKLGHTAG